MSRPIWYFRAAALLALALCLVVFPWMSGCEGGTGMNIVLTVAPASVAVGGAALVTATVTEAGVPSAGQVVSWSVVPAGAVTFASPTSVTTMAGVATVTATGATAGAASIRGSIGTSSGSAGLTVTGGGGGTAVAVSLSAASINVGGTSTATVTVTQAGLPLAGAAVTVATAPPGIATSTVPAATNAAGQTTSTLTGVAAGATLVTASSGGATSAPAPLTVSAPEQVVFATPGAITYSATPNNTLGALPVGPPWAGVPGFWFIGGVQPSGARNLMVIMTLAAADVRILNCSSGTTTAYAPAVGALYLAPGDPGQWARAAALDSAGSTIYWLRDAGANRDLMTGTASGAVTSVLLSFPFSGPRPVTLALSPDNSKLAWVDEAGQVVRMSLPGGSPLVLANTAFSAGPTALAWLDNSHVVVSFIGAMGGGSGLVSVHQDGSSPPSKLYPVGPIGMNSVPTSLAVDSAGDVICDEAEVMGGLSHDIVRITPGGIKQLIVARAADDIAPSLAVY